MKPFKTITAVVAFVWLFGIFIFFQRPNLDEDLERLRQRFTTKKHVAVQNELKNVKDSDILRELMLRAASRDAFRKDILKHWRQEIEKVAMSEKTNDLQKAGDSVSDRQGFRELPGTSLNQTDVGKTQRQALPVDKAAAIAPVEQQQHSPNDEETYDPSAPGEGGKPVIIDPKKLSPEERAKYDLRLEKERLQPICQGQNIATSSPGQFTETRVLTPGYTCKMGEDGRTWVDDVQVWPQVFSSAPDVVAVTVTSSGSAEVNLGDNVQLTCRVTGLLFFSQNVKWAKVDNKDPRVTKEISSHNLVMYNPVHYRIAAAEDDGDLVYTFTITDVQKSDDGAYKCFVEENGHIIVETTETLTVKQPVASLEFNVGSYKIQSTDQGVQEFELEQFDPNLVLNCKVRGSNPAPQVVVKVGAVDVTLKLRREDQMILEGNTFESIRSYNTDLDSAGVYPFNRSVVGKELSCSAWLQGNIANKLEAKALLKVKGGFGDGCGGDRPE